MNKTSLFEFSSIEELEKQIFDKYNSDEEFKKEREKVYYKGFKIGDLIFRSTKHTINSSAKNIDCVKIKDALHPIGNTGMTALNNGIVNYVSDIGEVSIKKIKNCITVSPGGNGTAGAFFYQPNYIISTGNNNLVEFFDKNFENQLKCNEKAFMCFAKLLTLSLKNKFHCFARNIGTGNDFNRELILLPVYQDENNQEHISVKTLSYLYDRIKFNEYKQKIEKLEREIFN